MNILIIGYGSIGVRHFEILDTLKHRVSVLSKRKINVALRYSELSVALQAEKPSYIVIANKTSEHYATLMSLIECDFNGTIIIEKPLFCNPVEMPTINTDNIYVAYNMRFNPMLQCLKKELIKQRVISVQAYAGQYLPEWRTNQDYRESYSANKNEGGGVIRDLSHELDFLNWLFGGWKSVTALGGHFSELEIDTDDIFSLMIEMNNCPIVSIEVNYLDRVTNRKFIINTADHVYQVDFIKKNLQIDDKVKSFYYDRNYSYIKQHQALLDGNLDNLCSFQSAVEVLDLISAAEHSAYAKQRCWISNETNL